MIRRGVILSKSMEKSFLRLSRPTARRAFVESEVVTGLATQIRVLRQQRGWTQFELAKKLGTTQTVVSRLEDPSYGKQTVATLVALSAAFDTGLSVKFTSLLEMFRSSNRAVDRHELEVESFESEASMVGFDGNNGDLYVTAVFVPDQTSQFTTISQLTDLAGTAEAGTPNHIAISTFSTTLASPLKVSDHV